MRKSVKRIYGLATALTAVLLACLITGAVMACLGYQPLSAYYQLVFGSIGGKSALCESVVKATPLVLTGLSFSIAFKAGLINLGATGQVYIGALFTTLAATCIPGLPAAAMIPLALLAGAAGGMVPGALVGFLKNRFQANELITTIMLNQIAILLVNCLVDGPMKDLEAISLYPQSRAVAASAELPRLVKGTRLHSGLLIALAALAFYGFFLWKTKWGYEIRVAGQNPDAAHTAGIPQSRTRILAMALAGGFAGLAGGIELLAIHHRLLQSFAGNIGFDGIAVALLGGNHPAGILSAALLFGMLSNGSNKMQMLSNVPNAVVYLLQGLIVLFVVGSNLYTKEFWQPYLRAWKRKRKEAE